MNTETQFNEESKHGKVYCASGFCGSFEEYNTAAKKHKQQTAVEWLFYNLNISGGSEDIKAFEQAKQMEKEQILKAHRNGSNHFEDLSANEYYNINFTNDSIDPD